MGVAINNVYIDRNNLPGDLIGNLESVTVNAGSAFLAGEAANLLKKPANIVDNSLKIYNTVTDINVIKSITTDLVEHSATVVVNELTSYITDKTTDLLSVNKMVDALGNSVTYWTKEYLLKPEEILSIIQTKEVEKENKKKEEKKKNEKLEAIKEKSTAAIGTCKKYVEKTVSSLDAGISTIAAYVSLGPDWVITQVNSYVSQVIEKAEGFIGSYTNLAIRTRDTAIDVLGNGIGYMAASTVNGIAILTAKKAKAKIEQEMTDKLIKAQNIIIAAVMKIRQLTGIAIPATFIPLPKISKLF